MVAKDDGERNSPVSSINGTERAEPSVVVPSHDEILVGLQLANQIHAAIHGRNTIYVGRTVGDFKRALERLGVRDSRRLEFDRVRHRPLFLGLHPRRVGRAGRDRDPRGVEVTTVATAPELPPAVARRGITEAQWRTLCNSLFPGADSNSVLMVWDYCLARKLDPLKKPCHIVPMEVKVKTEAGTRYVWRDVVMPGIYEHRTTAQRTGHYLGHTKPEYGPEIQVGETVAPAWCSMTVKRWNAVAQREVEFPVTVFFREVVALKGDGKPNSRWSRAPIQMLTKCAEAAALREAFPDELGGEQTFEEMDGQRAIDAPVAEPKALPAKPDGYDNQITDLEIVADEGFAKFEEAFKALPDAISGYLAKHDSATWEALKGRAITADEKGGDV